jgi:hypothetical protein
MTSILEPRLGLLQLAVMAVGLLIAYEVCFRIGRQRRDEVREAKKAQADVAVASLLALLGLMLAFSFSIGADRFAERKRIVLDEANSIATAYLRAELLPAPYDQRIQALLRRYVEARLELKTAEDVERAIAKSAELHVELWANATAAARAAPSPITAVFIDSLNHVIDLHEARVTVALFQRIPPAIFASLYLVAILSIAMVGLRAGLDRLRGLAPAVLLIAAISCVLALIASLDDPKSHMFRISNHAMADTHRAMAAHTALSAAQK